MKQFLKATLLCAVAALVAALPASAQVGNTTTTFYAATPSGPCGGVTQFALSPTNLSDCPNGTWNVVGGAGGGTAFSAITSGTNTAAAMVLGTGSSLSTSGSGTNAATSAPFSGITGSTNTNAPMVVGYGSGQNASVTPSGVGQITGTTNWYSPGGGGIWAPQPTLTGSLTGGSLVAGSTEYIQITINQGANTSLPSAEESFGLNAGNNCTGGGSCSVTVTAPTLINGETYTVYSTNSSGGGPGSEKQQTASSNCVNITTNCVIQLSGTGASPPSTNTAAGVTPSPVGNTSNCRAGMNPISWLQDANQNWEQGACIDTTMTNNDFAEKGFLYYPRPVLFNSSGADPAGSTPFSYNGALNIYTRPQANKFGLGAQILIDDSQSDTTNYTTSWRGIYSEIDVNGNPQFSGVDVGAHALRGTAALRYTGGTMANGNIMIGVSGFAERVPGSNAQCGSANLCLVGMQGIAGDNGTTNAISVHGIEGMANNAGSANSAGVAIAAVRPISAYFPALHAAFGVDAGWAAGANRWAYLNDSALPSFFNGPMTMPSIGPSAGPFSFAASITNVSSLGTAQLTQPSTPGVTTIGTPGSTSYTYAIVGKDGNGGTITSVGQQGVATGNAVLTSSNANVISFTCNPGFAAYDVYRTASSGTPATTGKIGTVTTTNLQRGAASAANGCTFTDTGLAGDGSSLPVGNTTGGVQAWKYSTLTNCAVNSASPAACGSASVGAVVIPTTTTTYTVNTTAVTSHSRIQLTWLTFASDLPSSPTCVAPSTTTMPTISAVSVGVSFTIALTSTTGQTCPEFDIKD